ncbi:hypothetical protein HYU22_02065 [Candidatus Woesearchaeota archaeon]|nr:hypothetical protein [Candidatus Woesearchaeota archaeon]
MKASVIISIMIISIFLVGCTLVSRPDVAEEVVVAESAPPEAAPEAPVEPAPAAEAPATETAPSPVTGAVIINTNTSTSHTINMVDGGFEDTSVTINAGDTVVWQNIRENTNLNEAMVIGTRDCRYLKSKFFNPGEHFSYKFTKLGVCTVVDGIFTTQMMEVIVK